MDIELENKYSKMKSEFRKNFATEILPIIQETDKERIKIRDKIIYLYVFFNGRQYKNHTYHRTV